MDSPQSAADADRALGNWGRRRIRFHRASRPARTAVDAKFGVGVVVSSCDAAVARTAAVGAGHFYNNDVQGTTQTESKIFAVGAERILECLKSQLAMLTAHLRGNTIE